MVEKALGDFHPNIAILMNLLDYHSNNNAYFRKILQMKLDSIDRKIIATLQTDSRLTLQEIADRVGLTASPCHRRITRLERDGIITRYSAMVNQKAVGLPVSVFVSVKLERQKERELELFSKAIAKWPEVVECYLMTGPRDYLMRVVAPDHMAYEQFLKQKLTRLEGVASIESSFALDQIKYSVALPLTP
jgi:Lrp/AsnC family leucine-responsive transcriptional regulator